MSKLTQSLQSNEAGKESMMNLSLVPENYICIKCKSVGQHWIQQCNVANKALPDGYAFYRSIGSPKYLCAPMVEQSEVFIIYRDPLF